MKDLFSPYKFINHWNKVGEMVEKKEEIYPITVEISLTNYCNHNCEWCYSKDFKKRVPLSINRTDLFNVLKGLRNFGVKAVLFTGGGEPLQHEDFELILKHTKLLGYKIGVITNGEFLSKYVDVIKETCDFVRVSIDASNARTHKRLHNTNINTFRDILKGLKKLCENKGNLIVGTSFLLHSENYYELLELVDILSILKVDYLHVSPIYLKSLTFSQGILNRMKYILDKVKKLAKSEKLKIIILNNKNIEKLDDFASEKCHACRLSLVIGADGKVYLCSKFLGNQKFQIGDIHTDTLQGILFQQSKMLGKVDLQRCPPCRYKEANSIIDYLVSEKRHGDFI